jgi:hypothetical protein
MLPYKQTAYKETVFFIQELKKCKSIPIHTEYKTKYVERQWEEKPGDFSFNSCK